MLKENIYFLKKEELTNIFRVNTFENIADILAEKFFRDDEDNLYILEEEKVKGLVAIGDLIRYYEGKKTEVLNTNYTFLKQCDFNKAEEIFREKQTIYEIPIIDREGKLEGVIKRNKKRA